MRLASVRARTPVIGALARDTMLSKSSSKVETGGNHIINSAIGPQRQVFSIWQLLLGPVMGR